MKHEKGKKKTQRNELIISAPQNSEEPSKKELYPNVRRSIRFFLREDAVRSGAGREEPEGEECYKSQPADGGTLSSKKETCGWPRMGKDGRHNKKPVLTTNGLLTEGTSRRREKGGAVEKKPRKKREKGHFHFWPGIRAKCQPCEEKRIERRGFVRIHENAIAENIPGKREPAGKPKSINRVQARNTQRLNVNRIEKTTHFPAPTVS